ncbi:hypothetical protein DPX39_040073500 [Trypanosoma brucei equiperdum]|uniref:SET domain containing protein n=1 Tax=Trypanosoma brucei equiperdum TaxID=630700 RepID=A0A3L6L944_9TRYP|nr:hypothetical protein DPX39_040073500 [Trypanosoma brucei equiperdum]
MRKRDALLSMWRRVATSSFAPLRRDVWYASKRLVSYEERDPANCGIAARQQVEMNEQLRVALESVEPQAGSSLRAEEVQSTIRKKEMFAPRIATLAAVAALTGGELPPVVYRKPKFSFLSDPSERHPPDALSVYEVPNNSPKAPLPMWASSLTSPQLGRQRIRVENWISTDSMGTVPEDHVQDFLAWFREELIKSSQTALWNMLTDNVDFHLRSQYSRGLVARKPFHKGDMIFAVPLYGALGADSADEFVPSSPASSVASEGNLTPWSLTINSENLQRHSVAAQRRGVPSYQSVEAIVGQRKSSFDPLPHPLFVDQVHFALLLACERAEGAKSPLFSYLRLLSPFDDDFIRELHLGVLDPATHLEYTDHCGRFSHYLRQIRNRWQQEYESAVCSGAGEVSSVDGSVSPNDGNDVVNARSPIEEGKTQCTTPGRLPPPSMDDLAWALRVVLSRQRLLPLRRHTEHFEDICSEEKVLQKLHPWTRLITKMHMGVMDNIFRVVDRNRVGVNDFQPHTIATIVPIVDMLQHPPGGMSNTSCSIEKISLSNDSNKVANTAGMCKEAVCAVVRANSRIEEGDELTQLYPRCYSVSYTLYRFGFLPLRRRADDAADAVLRTQR